MKTRPLDFSGTLAMTAASLSPFWSIEPLFARAAFVQLALVNASQHRDEYEQSGQRLGFSDSWDSGILPEDYRLNFEAYKDARNIGDVTGGNLQVFAKNADGSRKPYPIDSGVALLSVSGVMQKADAGSMEESGTNTLRARRVVNQVRTDTDVKAVVIRFNTPGGTSEGNAEFADAVRKLSDAKPTYAYIDGLCASAGYYVASQCNAIYASPSSLGGSIASLMTTYDYSAAFAEMGVEPIVLAPDNAPYKGTGAMGAPITDDQRAYLQGIVNTYAGQFRSAVKRGRDFSDEQLSAVWDGRVFSATDMRSLGLINGITSYDNVLATMKRVKAS